MHKAPDKVSTVNKLAVVHTSDINAQKVEEAGGQKFAFTLGYMSFRPAWDA